MIVLRSGYSALMDIFESKILFSITSSPNQKEQENRFNLWDKKPLRDSTSLIQNKKQTRLMERDTFGF